MTRVYALRDREQPKGFVDKICEPQASSPCGRNIFMLSGALFVTGFAGVEPKVLLLFGMKPPRRRA